MRLALIHHKSLATALKGVQQERTISDVFEQQQSGKTLIDMLKLDLIVGSGGILSHAPRRMQSMLMMVDAYEPLGVTRLSVDSIFMMPHLGVLSTINEKAATDVFVRDCMVYLGTCVAPIGQGKDGERCADYDITFPDGRVDKGQLAVRRLAAVSPGQRSEGLDHDPAGETGESRSRGGSGDHARSARRCGGTLARWARASVAVADRPRSQSGGADEMVSGGRICIRVLSAE